MLAVWAPKLRRHLSVLWRSLRGWKRWGKGWVIALVLVARNPRAGAAARSRAVTRAPAQPMGEPEDERIDRDRDQGPGQDQALGVRGQQAEASAQHGQHEGELADLGEAGRDPERQAKRPAE